MDTKLFSLGDVVALKTHPYFTDITNIIISGDQQQLPPLMIIVELLRAKEGTEIDGTFVHAYNCKCLWYSHKSYRLEHAWIMSSELKLIKRKSTSISIEFLKRGEVITLNSARLELLKKKSSLHYEDNTLGSGAGNTLVNALLSFLPPLMHFIEKRSHISKAPIKDKATGDVVRIVSMWDIKCSWFNPSADKISEIFIPIEALELVDQIDEKIIELIVDTIKEGGYLKIVSDDEIILCKPRNITSRNGYYFVRAFDYMLNKIVEYDINSSSSFSIVPTPFDNVAPKFDVEKYPEAVTVDHMKSELITAISEAKKNRAYIRIKYKNRNDQLTIRTLKEYRIIEGKEDGVKMNYLVGFCLLREEERTFKLERIQNFQELILSY